MGEFGSFPISFFADDAAVEQEDLVGGKGGHARVVGDHQNGAAVAVQTRPAAHDTWPLAVSRLPVGSVGQHQALIDQRAGDGDALPLAAG